jgi:hypothetical protein
MHFGTPHLIAMTLKVLFRTSWLGRVKKDSAGNFNDIQIILEFVTVCKASYSTDTVVSQI